MKTGSLLLIALLAVSCTPNSESAPTLLAGAAARSITPDKGAFIAGGGNDRRATGVHDSLFVKALILSDQESSIAILTFDCIGMLYPTLLAIRREAKRRLPAAFNPDHIVMSSTHTHSGPDVVGIWGPEPTRSGVDSGYMQTVVARSVEALENAWARRQPARVVYAETQHGEEWVYNISDSLNLDRSLVSMQFLDQTGNSIATLNNFACHPTIMDGRSTEISADYVGGTYRILDQELGGENLFLQGAIGGWVQPEYVPQTFASAQEKGTGLGQAILQALTQATPLAHTALKYRSRVFSLPVSNVNFQQLAGIGVIQRDFTDSVETEIAWFSVGPAQFITHPGETTPTHSQQSKALMNTSGPKFVLGLGMDALGYILTPDFYADPPPVKHAAYQGSMSVDPAAGPLLMQEIEKIIRADQ